MLTEMIKNSKNIFEEGNFVAKGNEEPLNFLRFTIFENIEK